MSSATPHPELKEALTTGLLAVGDAQDRGLLENPPALSCSVQHRKDSGYRTPGGSVIPPTLSVPPPKHVLRETSPDSLPSSKEHSLPWTLSLEPTIAPGAVLWLPPSRGRCWWQNGKFVRIDSCKFPASVLRRWRNGSVA